MRAHRFSALRGYSNALLISLDSLSSCPGLSLESSLTFLRRDTKSRDKQECKCEKAFQTFADTWSLYLGKVFQNHINAESVLEMVT